MKKRLLSVLICATMAVTMLGACGSKPAEEAPAEETATEASTQEVAGGQKIGISVPKAVTGWTAAIQYYAEKYCKENNLDAVVVAAENTNEQANQIEELINMGCDAIVLLPINDELATAAQKIMDAGIVLVNYDRTLGATTPDYYVGGDNPGVGHLGAEYLQEKLGDEYNVVIMGASGWGAISQERIDGYKEKIAEITPNVTILGEYAAGYASQEEGLSLMADILSANPEIDAVFSVDDEQANGIIRAIREANRTDIKAVTAGGGVKGYATNMLSPEFADMWLATATYYPTMIVDAIKVAEQVLAGESPETSIIIPCTILDRDNVEQWREENNVDEDAPY